MKPSAHAAAMDTCKSPCTAVQQMGLGPVGEEAEGDSNDDAVTPQAGAAVAAPRVRQVSLGAATHGQRSHSPDCPDQLYLAHQHGCGPPPSAKRLKGSGRGCSEAAEAECQSGTGSSDCVLPRALAGAGAFATSNNNGYRYSCSCGSGGSNNNNNSGSNSGSNSNSLINNNMFEPHSLTEAQQVQLDNVTFLRDLLLFDAQYTRFIECVLLSGLQNTVSLKKQAAKLSAQ
jgi:hypothetical protein